MEQFADKSYNISEKNAFSGGFLSRGFLAKGVFVQGVFVRGFMSGGFCLEGFVLIPSLHILHLISILFFFS